MICGQVEELEEGTKGIKTGQDEGRKDLELKMENLLWKMSMFFVCLAILVYGIVVRYVAM